MLELDSFKDIDEIEKIIEDVKKEFDVDYAEPVRIAKPAFTLPNDQYYNLQWNLQSTTSYPAAINMPLAWDITRGSTSIVVAVLDTGILVHQDFPSSRILSGYDMISNSVIANDGDGRDNDPSDPGDWCSAQERNNPQHPCYDSSCAPNCNQIDSSWHGLFVTGIIAAQSNNSSFISAIDWNVKILPVRVLGKGGGYSNDIADAIRWASGVSVSGLPTNPNPARVINMSLSGQGPCGSYLQSAINDAVSREVLVVVAAGNENSDASNYFPGNCSNVVTVSALNRLGSKASYSNYGSVVFISAPGGDRDGYPVYSIINGGTTTPATSDYDTAVGYIGTSMAAPHVSAVASLMLALKPSLTLNNIRYNIQKTARNFPGGSSCNTSICGAGMLDAYSSLDNLIIQLSSTTPSSAENTGNVSVSIFGKGFLNGAQVKLKRDGFADIDSISTNVINLNRIDATLPLSTAATGLWSVEVINTDGSSSTLSNYFYVSGFFVSSITPVSADNLTSDLLVTILGSGFSLPLTVRLQKTGYADISCSNLTLIDSTTLRCTFNLLGAFAGMRDLFVANGNGRTQTILNAFNITNAAVSINSLLPQSAYNNASVSIGIRGSGFSKTATARFFKVGYSDVNCSVDVLSSTYAVCSLDLNGAFAGKRDFEFTTATTTITLPNGFEVLNSPLYIYYINPPSSSNNQSSVVLKVFGSGFVPSLMAKLSKTGYSDILASNYSIYSSTYMSLTFNLLNAPYGKRDFTIYYGTVSYTKTDAFTILDALASPIIYRIEPQSSFNDKDPVINIYGDNFISGIYVKILNSSSEITINNFDLISSTAILNVVLPLKGYPQGKWSVKVINPDFKSYVLSNAFTLLEVKDEVRIYEPVIKPYSNSLAKIVYNMPDNGEVSITVYDNLGNKIRSLYKGMATKGLSEILWDGKDDLGSMVRSGIYIIEIKTPFYRRYKRISVVK